MISVNSVLFQHRMSKA